MQGKDKAHKKGKGPDKRNRWEELKKIMEDATVVVEVVDIRDMAGTRLPIAEKMSGSNRLLIFANKADLVEKSAIPELPSYAIAISSKTMDNAMRQHLIEAIIARSTKVPARALLVGYPNVGKSTLVNMLARRKAAKVSAIAGTTKNVQWIKISDMLTITDYRGVFPKHESRESLMRKNALNISEDTEMHAYKFAERILHNGKLRAWAENKFDIDLKGISHSSELINAIAKRRGWVIKGGELNLGEAARALLRAMIEAPEI